jgi:EAL domain-containing protein (putative c-di-GMP-specific phosphodiesterase class I)
VARSLTTLAESVHECGATLSVDDIRSAPEAAWWRRTGADTATGPLFAEPDLTTLFPKR